VDVVPEMEEALDTVEHAAKGEFWTAARAALECDQEVPFMYKRNSTVTELVTGTIDFTYRTPEGWCVVDCKTDESFSPEALVRYRAQVSAYEQAWARVTGMVTTGALAEIRVETGAPPSDSEVKEKPI
jgi:ATP-dependent exoDNAse (exonuclease V) beta subunit